MCFSSLPFFWGKVFFLSFCFSRNCRWWGPSRTLKNNIEWRKRKGRKGREKWKGESGQNESFLSHGLCPWVALRMRGVQQFRVWQPSNCSKFLKKTRDALTGLAESMHLLLLELYGLYVTLIKGHVNLVCETDVGSTDYKSEQSYGSSTTMGNCGGIPSGFLLKKPGLGSFGEPKTHASPWLAIGSVNKGHSASPFTFPTQTTCTLRVATRPLCEMDTQYPSVFHLVWQKGPGWIWAGAPAGSCIQQPRSNSFIWELLSRSIRGKTQIATH